MLRGEYSRNMDTFIISGGILTIIQNILSYIYEYIQNSADKVYFSIEIHHFNIVKVAKEKNKAESGSRPYYLYLVFILTNQMASLFDGDPQPTCLLSPRSQLS